MLYGMCCGMLDTDSLFINSIHINTELWKLTAFPAVTKSLKTSSIFSSMQADYFDSGDATDTGIQLNR